MKNLLEIFETLSINRENGLFITSENLWNEECQFSSRIKRLIGNKLKPDAFFNFDNKPLILFYDNPKDTENIHKALWNFNESPIIIFAFDEKIEVFNGFTYLIEKSSLQFIGKEDCLGDFNYFEIVTGNTWAKYQENLHYETRVDYRLLKNIEVARDILITQNNLEASIANALIGKVIFVRYLIDQQVKIGYDGESRLLSNDELCSILSKREKAIGFFKYLEERFNGDMFLLEERDYQSITNRSFETIISLLSEDDLGNGQKSLFKLYDFAIIPIEFISNVYESFIGNQEEDSAYYTPLFLVDYILAETVENYLKNNTKEYNCRVLDPACGSGIFLVETLRKIIEKFIALNPDIKEDSDEFKDVLKRLAIDNIFGIDKNLSAIQVAIFSLQLTLLDYQEPASIETFRFPKLLNTNFFEADFFNTEHLYNDLLGKKNLNFIIGNPPWRRGNGEKSPFFVKYINERNKREKQEYPEIENRITISNNEIAQAFLLRVSDFSISDTVSLIVTSKVLYNLNGKNFRKYFLDNFIIQKVFELAPVRRKVFDKSADKAISPAVVILYKAALGQNTDNNEINHITLKSSRFFNLFKIFSLTSSDFKKVSQRKLKEYDWLWKILVYGSYYDFNFINRLISDYPKISDVVYHGKDYIVKQGIKRLDGKRKIDVSELVDYDFIDLTKKQIEQFAIGSNLDKWQLKSVGYVYRENEKICTSMFSPPLLLIKETVQTNLESVAAISNKQVVFTDKITSIKKRDGSDDDNYYTLAALLNSNLFSYFISHFASTTGIMIEQQINDIEKFRFPYIKSIKFKNLIKLYEAERLSGSYNKAEKYKKELSEIVEDSFTLSEQEKVLVDYTTNYVIPQMMNLKTVDRIFRPILENEKSFIESYAQLFIDRFSPSLNTKNQEFIVEIWHSNQIIGMFFKVVPKGSNQQSIVWKNKAKEKLLSKAIELSSQKITDKLFVQKYFRGFEKEFFYIFKPNEKRLWHKAIGYQDVDEFMDAILKTNRRTYSGK